MRTTIYLIRHGKCPPNRDKIFRSRGDYPLNVTGIRQAELLAQELSQVKLDAVYSSPLTRALKTAEIVCRPHELRPVVINKFNNMDIGPWEGRPHAEIAKEFPEQYETLYSRIEELRIEGAESLADVQKRAMDSLEELVTKHSGVVFAVVSHHTVLIPLFAGLLEIPAPYFTEFDPSNASYTLFEHTPEQGYSLRAYNYTGHLENTSTSVRAEDL